jgi:hypothetical protein
MSVVNCRVIICRSHVRQNLSLLPPAILKVEPVQNNSFPGCFKSIFLVSYLSRPCQNKPNNFYYICSEVVLKSQRKPLPQLMRKGYELYFGCNVGGHDELWAPKSCCSWCSRTSAGWLKGTHKSMRFAGPMVCREPQDHLNDCCFCITKITGFSRFCMHIIEYLNIRFAVRPVPHDDSMPLAKQPKSFTLDSNWESEES